jgi:hypothetical protein
MSPGGPIFARLRQYRSGDPIVRHKKPTRQTFVHFGASGKAEAAGGNSGTAPPKNPPQPQHVTQQRQQPQSKKDACDNRRDDVIPTCRLPTCQPVTNNKIMPIMALSRSRRLRPPANRSSDRPLSRSTSTTLTGDNHLRPSTRDQDSRFRGRILV